MEVTFEVRDVRDKEWFLTDDYLINGYAHYLDTCACMVYITLCRFSDKEQKCWPSQSLIAKRLGISRRTVVDKIKLLQSHNMIYIEKKKDFQGRQTHNTYWLINKKYWKNYQEYQQDKIIAKMEENDKTECNICTYQSANNSNNRVQDLHTKDTNKKETGKRRIDKPSFPASEYFQQIWERYPRKIGKDKARKHFLASVKNEDDFSAINKALDIYLASDVVRGGYVRYGSTWFNSWRDWLDYREIKVKDKIDPEIAKLRAV